MRNIRTSVIIPFHSGKDFLKDCFDSLKEQIILVHFDMLEGQKGFEKLEKLRPMAGLEGRFEVEKFLKNGDLSGLDGLKKIVGYRDLLPYLPNEEEADADEKISQETTEEEIERPYFYLPYHDYEVILVKDHVEEDIEDLISEYSQYFEIRVISVDNEKILRDEPVDESKGHTVTIYTGCCGVAAARNAGIEAAKGDYIFFLDSDDYLFPRALSCMDSAISVNDEPDVVYGKKVWTWYSRAGFLATFNSDNASEENDSAADDSAEDASAAEEAAIEAERLRAEMEATLSPEEYIDFRRGQAAHRLISRRKGIRNVSALNICIKKSLIDAKKLRFPVDFKYYSDFSFVCEVLCYGTTFRKNYKSVYAKRKHGDPINFPSLAQEKMDGRFEELLRCYRYTHDLLPAKSSVLVVAEKKFINYYTEYYVTRLRRSEDDKWRTERFAMMAEALSDVSPRTLKEIQLYKKRLLKSLKKRDAEKTHKQISGRLFWRKLLGCVINRTERIKSFYIHSFMKKPVQENWVMFECFFGKSYGDNPKGIYEYLAKNYGDKYKFIWSMEKGTKSKIPYKCKKVRRMGLRYAYYLARCKYFVFNTKQPGYMRKREEQVFLETWHGTPLKRLAFDMEDNFSAAPGYKKHIYSKTRSWDYLVAPNRFTADIFKSCFMYDGHMLEYGYPRNDILHSPDREAKAAELKKKLGIPADKKTILYAPTWRDDEFYAAGQYKFTLKLELPKLRAALGDEYVILLRTHYYIADKLDVTGMEGFAYNLSKYDDIAEIYLISDICITDYSSVFFDYANLRRPILFYTYDIDKYRDMLRGFYFDMESTVPGPLLYTTEEVIDAIKNIDSLSEKFSERYDAFYERFCGWENGKASENIVRDVFLEDVGHDERMAKWEQRTKNKA